MRRWQLLRHQRTSDGHQVPCEVKHSAEISRLALAFYVHVHVVHVSGKVARERGEVGGAYPGHHTFGMSPGRVAPRASPAVSAGWLPALLSTNMEIPGAHPGHHGRGRGPGCGYHGDAPGRPDLPPFAGYRTPYTAALCP